MGRRNIRDRSKLVEEHVRLHGEGFSHREIAERTGVHHSTVQADLKAWHDQLMQSLSDPWPRERRLAWLVAHPGDEVYPWRILADSPDSGAAGIRRNPPVEGRSNQA